MAPSPTGEFHIGSMRTLLYNYAFAKKNGGHFILRVEDTDRERYVEGSLERTLQVIKDYGLEWDEGPEAGGPNGPYIQSERLEIYKKYAHELVEKGYAYYCFCTKERLDSLRKQQQEAHLPATRYDRHCLTLTPEQVKSNLDTGTPYVVRLKVPSDRTLVFKDIFLGEVSFPSNDVEDQILLKSDGFPTYHLAVVVDDHLMEITHILRGSEWLASTPKHILLYEFLGWKMPATGHLPGLKEVGSTKKMSKRFGDVSAVEFLKNGYLPEALLNFLMLLGWNPGTEKEIFTLSEFINTFSLERIHTSDLVAFDREKLSWINGYYIRQLSDSALLERIKNWAERWQIPLVSAVTSGDFAIRVTGLIKDRMHTLGDFNQLAGYFFKAPEVDFLLLSKFSGDRWKDILSGFKQVFEKSDWEKDDTEKLSHDYVESCGFSLKEAFMTLRVAVTGETATPPLFDILSLLGKQEVLHRINSALTINSI